MLVLPIDQGLEHGPVDFFVNPQALDPDYQFRLAKEANFSAIALHYGLATKYYARYAGQVPLILDDEDLVHRLCHDAPLLAGSVKAKRAPRPSRRCAPMSPPWARTIA